MRTFFSARILLPLIALLLASAAVVLDPIPLQTLRNAVFDQYQRWSPRVYQDVGVRIVDIDEESLARMGQWPWPRTRIADMVDALRKAGVQVIAFDVLFAEPDRTSPSVALKQWQHLTPEAAMQIAALPDPDDLLAASLQKGGVVLGVAEAIPGRPLPAPKFGAIVRGASDIPSQLPTLSGSIPALPVLSAAAAGNGTITFLSDSDGVVRRIPLITRVDNAVLPSLVAAALRVSAASPRFVLHADGTALHQLDVGPYRIPTMADGQFWLHFTRDAPGRTLPAWQVLSGAIPDGSLNGVIAVVGSSAQGLQDLRFGPLGGVIPGVEMHAQAMEQIRLGHWLERPFWALPFEALVLLLTCLALGILAHRVRAAWSALGTLAVLVLLNLAGWIAFRERLLLDMVTPSLAVVLTFVLASVSRHMMTEAQQRWIQQAFSRYVSPNRVAYLMANPQALSLGGQRQHCSFVFTDLTDFTGMVERSEPEQVVEHLNAYLEGLVQIAFRHDGTLDRIVGDALAIMFSAPVPQADHAQRALRCAIEMRDYAARYANDLQARGIAFGRTRIGVHSGEVVVGNFGGETLFDYRAMGDAVNTTARLETLNLRVGTSMCVSDVIRQASPERPMRAVGKVRLKGKSKFLDVFEPLDAEDKEYEAAFVLLADEDPQALAAFAQLHAQRPQDGLIAFHHARLQAGQYGELIEMRTK